MTSDTGKWINNGATITIDSTSTLITTSTNGEKNYTLSEEINLPYIAEFDYITGSGEYIFNIGVYDGTNPMNWYINHNGVKYNLYTFPNAYTSTKTSLNKTASLNDNSHFQIIVESGKVSVKCNGELILSKTQGKNKNPQQFSFYTNLNRVMKIKNFKVKPYMGT